MRIQLFEEEELGKPLRGEKMAGKGMNLTFIAPQIRNWEKIVQLEKEEVYRDREME